MRSKITVFLTCIFLTFNSFAQLKIEARDMTNLVAMSQFYSANSINKYPGFAKSIDSLRTPLLTNLADALILMNKGDASIFQSKFFSRPAKFEMTLWYVVREIHYNHTSKTRKPRPDMDIAREYIVKQIDDRWLVDNYYYRLLGGTGSLLNQTDMSTTNIDLEQLGLRDSAEKAIVYLNTIEALIGGRFIMLLRMNANDKILAFCERLPQFNGQWYYYFKNFTFGDFEYQGLEKPESYFMRHIDKLYNVLIAHYNAGPNVEYQHELYYNSMMNQPQYFEFSILQPQLQAIYESQK